jgi:cation diffusion facilitator family transporter
MLFLIQFVLNNIMKYRSSVYIALAADTGIAATKFITSVITGSSAMASEGIHSIIDCISQLLLLWGIKKSKQKADEKRPFGYGRELYFWSFIVSLIMFTLGGCISFYEGLQHFRKHPSIDGQSWNYLVLAVAFVFTVVSATPSLKIFNKQRGNIPFWKAITRSKDPSVFIVLLGDLSDLAGIIVAFAGIYISHVSNNPDYDGIASIIIGCILITTSLLLVRESRSLLMGEAPNRKTLQQIIALVEQNETLVKVKRHFSIYLAPDEVVLQLIVVFKNDLTTQEITAAIETMIKSIQLKFPLIKQIFIEPSTNK